MTIAEQLALEAKELNFEELPAEVIHQVKHSVLDTIGIGFGGYMSEPSRIMQSVIQGNARPCRINDFRQRSQDLMSVRHFGQWYYDPLL